MEKIQKQIAKYIKDVACGYGLKDVHVYVTMIKLSDQDFSKYAFTSSVDDFDYFTKSSKTVEKIYRNGIYVVSNYADTIRDMKDHGWKFLI